ncbi:MAG: hypothetical protein ACLQSR_04445 [Limisphaerales bacterium]
MRRANSRSYAQKRTAAPGKRLESRKQRAAAFAEATAAKESGKEKQKCRFSPGLQFYCAGSHRSDLSIKRRKRKVIQKQSLAEFGVGKKMEEAKVASAFVFATWDDVHRKFAQPA